MTLIEGIGDEVTHFFLCLFGVLVIYLAWWTTSTREQHQIRVFVLNGRQRNYSRLSSHVETATIMEGSHAEDVTDPGVSEQQATNASAGDEQNKPETSNASTSDAGNDGSSEDEPATILRIMDQNVNTVRQRRLDRFDQRQNAIQNESNARMQVQEVTPAQSVESKKNNNLQGSVASHVTSPEKSKITIKLKYLNDELKSVDGELKELLGNFKRRHFETELSSDKIVRLIFNGQVLQPDSATLQSCGLFDNCVVHCLIHQKRSRSRDSFSSSRSESTRHTRSGSPLSSRRNSNNNGPARDWDFGNLLFFLICFVLGTVWYFRYEYAHLYTVTATVALVIITGIFAVVVFGVYFPEREQAIPQAIH